MKTLMTERLILRALKPSDLDDFYGYAKKPTIGPSAGWKPHGSLEESQKILMMMISENEVWGITLKNSDQLIGTLGLHVRNFENALENKKEIGYVLDDVYWGRGLMVEAVKKVLDDAFMEQELSEVLCGHAVDNDRSRRVVEKTGFVYTHTEKRNHYDGTEIEIMMYHITKIQYLGGKMI
ncbi:MAG: GNAT family N-acetyltransferase [Acholeplasmataceae bacterium]|nr:GNAT family N-acetyltransferase [Acholeplasmataceae bacterium]